MTPRLRELILKAVNRDVVLVYNFLNLVTVTGKDSTSQEPAAKFPNESYCYYFRGDEAVEKLLKRMVFHSDTSDLTAAAMSSSLGAGIASLALRRWGIKGAIKNKRQGVKAFVDELTRSGTSKGEKMPWTLAKWEGPGVQVGGGLGKAYLSFTLL